MEISAGLWIWRRKFDTCAVCCMLMILCYIWNDSFQNTGTVGLHSRYRSKDVRDLVRLLQILNPHFGVVTIRLRWCRNQGKKNKILKIAIWLSSCNWSSSICSFRLWSFCLRLASVVLQLTETTWILGLLPEVLRKLHSCAMSYRLKRAGAVTIPQHLRWAIAGAPSAILSSVPLSHKFIVFLTTSRARCRRKKNGPTIWNDVVLRATLLRSGGEGPWSAAPVELASTPKGEPKAKNIYIE